MVFEDISLSIKYNVGSYITMETEWPVLTPQDLITIELGLNR